MPEARVIPLHRCEEGAAGALGGPLQAAASGELGDPQWYQHLALLLAFARRRVVGGYGVDVFGFDPDLTVNVLLPLLRPLYRRWFRVETIGMRHVPSEGGALVVANHSGTLPLDAMMTAVALHDHHPARRHLRMLGGDVVFRTPLLGSLARKSGQTLACRSDAARLLASGELVGVWPEGYKGIGKRYRDRYKLQHFGRGGFVSAALRTQTTIIPCSIVGAEEIYPMVGDIKPLARLLGLPYFSGDAVLPTAGATGDDFAAVQVVHRVRRACPHRWLRSWFGRGPNAGLQPHRPGTRDHPADPVPVAHPAP